MPDHTAIPIVVVQGRVTLRLPLDALVIPPVMRAQLVQRPAANDAVAQPAPGRA